MPTSVAKRLGHTTGTTDVEILRHEPRREPRQEQQGPAHPVGAARSMIEAHPFLGVGLGHFAESVDEYVDTPLPENNPRDAHNAYC